MSTELVKKADGGLVKYVPLGSEDAIQLSVAIIRNYIVTPTKSGAMPSNQDCMRLLALCRAQRLDPFQRDCYLTGYDGRNGPEFSIIVAHSVFLKRAAASKDYNGMQSGVVYVDADGERHVVEGEILPEGSKLLGGWARVHVKGREFPSFTTLELRAFRKDNKFWNENPCGMIRKCSEKDALGQAFPNILGLCAEIANGVDMDLPQVSVTVSPPARDQEQIEDPPKHDDVRMDYPPQAQSESAAAPETLVSWCQANGIKWDQFRAWAVDMGHVADHITSWDGVSVETSKRLLRAKTGMLAGIQKFNTK